MSQRDDASRQSVLGRTLDWWHEARERWARLRELRDLAPEEIERVALDVGLTPAELLRVAARPDGTLELLDRRLAALQLDADEIRKLSPLLLRDLQRTCALCSERQRCADDMAEAGPLAPGWESYCPNAGTLRTLR